ncbi:MAG: hypothetical protein IJO53_00635, partial [Clostridia bacterium]|nr:hypothetical protein [Clostridia bacterium]
MDIDRILVIDTGASDASAIARRIRSLNALAVIEDAVGLKPEAFSGKVRGVIVAGSGQALKVDNHLIRNIINASLPVLCFGKNARQLLYALGGVAGQTQLEKGVCAVAFLESPLFESVNSGDRYFERADAFSLPEGVSPIAVSDGGWVCAFAHEEKKLYGAQFSVESNDPDGMQLLKNFVFGICKVEDEWTTASCHKNALSDMQLACPSGKVVCAVSGSALSAIAASLAMQAYSKRVKCVLCDTGLMRKGEIGQIRRMFSEEIGVFLQVIDISSEVFSALSGAVDSREKHERVSREILKCLSREGDMIVRGAGTGGAFALTPLAGLFREEAKALGEFIGLPQSVLARQSFPEAGLALRVSGEVTREKIEILREADAVFSEEIENAALDKKLMQYYVTLAPA